MKNFEDLLKGGDLRSIGRTNEVVKEINSEHDFDLLFNGLFHTERTVVMRTADAIEKITIKRPALLNKYKKKLLELCFNVKYIELKWHLALLVSRLKLTSTETERVWLLLTQWATDRLESKIVRVNSVQALFELSQINSELTDRFTRTVNQIIQENIPSLNARIRKLKRISP